ncbi:D-amino acid dehydrogenase [Inhella sp.]|uniref:D-amino acid dehydrogenase n=1 Tax=Inhella sp. TaxID=1921806 RepID=UPI0035B37ADC
MQQLVVIGGGVVGLSTAWNLVEAGHRVRLLERQPELAAGASHANGGQLSYRYVSPLADQGVPLKALRWLMDPEGPLHFRPEARWAQWSWLAQFLWRCRGSVNRATTERLLALGAFSQRAFADLALQADLQDIQLRSPGKLVVYRRAEEFRQVQARLNGSGPEQALDRAACVALEPALQDGASQLAGGIFTPGEAVADCQRLCLALGERLRAHPRFEGQLNTAATGFALNEGRVRGVRTAAGVLEADGVVLAAGLQSRALAAPLGIRLPLYPLKGYSLTAPIAPEHRAPEVSVTDFERKTLYARIGQQLRVAAMVDLVGEDEQIDPRRLQALQRHVRELFPQAADYSRARPWTGLRPATPGGAPILGASPVPGLWLNVGHGALGFTFAFASARILAELVSGRSSPLPLDGLTLQAA